LNATQSGLRVNSSGSQQTALKIIPMLVVPVEEFFFFQSAHFTPLNPFLDLQDFQAITSASVTLFFCFHESRAATILQIIVKNPKNNISKERLLGIAVRISLIFFSSISLFGYTPG